MEWWQIALILLGSVVVGTGCGYVISRLIKYVQKGRSVFNRRRIIFYNKDRREVKGEKPVTTPWISDQKQIANTAAKDPEYKEKISMVPLFSRRSILVLSIGLIVGILLGFGYWAISPIDNIQLGWPPVDTAAAKEETPYQSTVNLQVMASGSSYMRVEDLRRYAAYYAGLMDTSSFFEFLSNSIAEEAPQYSRTRDELSRMISVDVWYEELIASIRIRVTSTSPEEAFFITNEAEAVFQDYLEAEERRIHQEEYQNKMAELQIVKINLLEAEKDLAAIQLEQENFFEISHDPDYIQLSAEVVALEYELSRYAAELAALTASGETGGAAYREARTAISRTSSALSQARGELSSMQAQYAVDGFEQRLAYENATTRVERLRSQQSSLIANLALWNEESAKATSNIVFSASGPPSNPVAVLPDKIPGKQALMMGAVCGVCVAWLAMNRRWLSQELLPSLTKEKEGES